MRIRYGWRRLLWQIKLTILYLYLLCLYYITMLYYIWSQSRYLNTGRSGAVPCWNWNTIVELNALIIMPHRWLGRTQVIMFLKARNTSPQCHIPLRYSPIPLQSRLNTVYVLLPVLGARFFSLRVIPHRILLCNTSSLTSASPRSALKPVFHLRISSREANLLLFKLKRIDKKTHKKTYSSRKLIRQKIRANKFASGKPA